ncbi:hypothetical protein EV424DRAFT_1603682 [Suillus variegatus]|nr:hypothetical protein EV424DRAFT_1603682 [Suillus variegatus]
MFLSPIVSPVSRLPSPVSHLPSPVSRLPSPVSRLPSPVSRLPSPVSRLPSPVSRLPSPVSRLPSPSPVSRLPLPSPVSLSRLPAQVVGLRTSYLLQPAPQSPQTVLSIMSDNPSFVLKSILDAEIQQSQFQRVSTIFDQFTLTYLIVLSCEVEANEILVEVKKTGAFTKPLCPS